MTKPLEHNADPDVTRHEVPALRRVPLDERLPRLSCAPQPIAWQPRPFHNIEAEKTVIGEIPALTLGGVIAVLPDAAKSSSSAQPTRVAGRQTAQRIPADRWILLAIAIATLGYSLRSAFPAKPVTLPPRPPTITSEPTSRTLLADPTSLYSMRAFAPSTMTGSPLDPTALETAAARALLAGHTEEAAQLYEQLETLSPGTTSVAAATAILRSNFRTVTGEATP